MIGRSRSDNQRAGPRCSRAGLRLPTTTGRRGAKCPRRIPLPLGNRLLGLPGEAGMKVSPSLTRERFLFRDPAAARALPVQPPTGKPTRGASMTTPLYVLEDERGDLYLSNESTCRESTSPVVLEDDNLW